MLVKKQFSDKATDWATAVLVWNIFVNNIDFNKDFLSNTDI